MKLLGQFNPDMLRRVYESGIREAISEPWFAISRVFCSLSYGFDSYYLEVIAYPGHAECLTKYTNASVDGRAFREPIDSLEICAYDYSNIRDYDNLASIMWEKTLAIKEKILDYMEDWYIQQLELNILQGLDYGYESNS